MKPSVLTWLEQDAQARRPPGAGTCGNQAPVSPLRCLEGMLVGDKGGWIEDDDVPDGLGLGCAVQEVKGVLGHFMVPVIRYTLNGLVRCGCPECLFGHIDCGHVFSAARHGRNREATRVPEDIQDAPVRGLTNEVPALSLVYEFADSHGSIIIIADWDGLCVRSPRGG